MTPEASFLIACVRQFLGAADDAEVERERAPVNQDALLDALYAATAPALEPKADKDTKDKDPGQ